jgi:demethoxyubiquinone hydroxylase (CLK1/Coq7/Cat5 family)
MSREEKLALETMEEVERQVAEHYAKLAEADRQYNVRREALAKVRSTLNPEELKLLGL